MPPSSHYIKLYSIPGRIFLVPYYYYFCMPSTISFNVYMLFWCLKRSNYYHFYFCLFFFLGVRWNRRFLNKCLKRNIVLTSTLLNVLYQWFRSADYTTDYIQLLVHSNRSNRLLVRNLWRKSIFLPCWTVRKMMVKFSQECTPGYYILSSTDYLICGRDSIHGRYLGSELLFSPCFHLRSIDVV